MGNDGEKKGKRKGGTWISSRRPGSRPHCSNMAEGLRNPRKQGQTYNRKEKTENDSNEQLEGNWIARIPICIDHCGCSLGAWTGARPGRLRRPRWWVFRRTAAAVGLSLSG